MSKQIYRVKSVIFDMDGVITNTMPDHFKAWHQILLELGVKATHEDIYSREGQSGIFSIQEILTKYGKEFNLAKAKRYLKKKENIFKKIVKIRFIQGARNLLKTLHRENFRLALVTGTSRHEMRQILPDSLYNLFEVTVTGDEVKHGKPHPEPYLKALKLLKLAPKEAVVIENAPFGIRSAKAAKMKCIALETSLSRKYLKEADQIFSSIRQFNEKTQFVFKS